MSVIIKGGDNSNLANVLSDGSIQVSLFKDGVSLTTAYGSPAVEALNCYVLNPITVNGTVTATNPSVGSTGATAPTSATYLGGKNAGNLVGVSVDASGNVNVNILNSTLAVTQSGTWTVGISASQTIAVTNTGTFAVQAAQSGSWTVAATQSGTWNVSQATAASLNATVVGTGTFAVQATQSGTWNVGTVTTVTAVTAITDALPAGSNLIGQVQTVPATSGGYSSHVEQALTTSASVKSSAGQLYGFDWGNPNTGTVYVFIYNTTSAPTIGSTTNLVYQKMLPAGAGSNVEFENGLACSTGIYIAVSTAATSATAPSTGLVLTTLYK